MPHRPDIVHARFFELLGRSRPDVIVLDFSRNPPTGADTILAIREKTDIPVLVVCNAVQDIVDEYRIAGAVDCIAAPVDIIRMNEAIQNIMRVRSRGRPAESRAPLNYVFSGMSFYRGRNLLVSEDGSVVELTSSEGRLLGHLLSKPWTLCTRAEIGELLYGPGHSVGDRAIDVIVNRLRRKLVLAGGPDAEQLVKTEFRRGYLLVSDIANLPHSAPMKLPGALREAI